ncbi:MAG: hypothetical protein RL449_767 [Bacteroidota bacterium]
MLSYNSIQSAYPVALHSKGRFIIREYLQYKLLEIIYSSVYSHKLVFLGGTNLRIVHENQRFSEDLDFDNRGMSVSDFNQLADIIVQKLEAEGYQAEIKTVFKGAYHCYIRFPSVLFDLGMSGHSEEKILLQLDTEPQNFDYTPNSYFLNKFDVFTQIFATPLEMLLAQKFYAVLNRPRNKGRDFYDIVFILSKTKEPDYRYLEQKLGINDRNSLLSAIVNHCDQLNMNEMAKDVAPFLFKPQEILQVQEFTNYIRTIL